MDHSMTVNKMFLRREELESALELMARFECSSVELVQETGSGIGTVLNAHLPVTIADTAGTYVVEITGVKDW
jgi:hypothetical protein